MNQQLMANANSFIEQLPGCFAEDVTPTFGVELEFGIIDSVTGVPLGLFDDLARQLPRAVAQQVQPEFLRCQIEYASRTHTDLPRLHDELAEFYHAAERLAAEKNAHLPWVANFPAWSFDASLVTDTPRSHHNLRRLGLNAQHLATNSLHVHVAVPRSQAIRVLDALQTFVPLFVALSANSPLHRGQFSGHRSHRCAIWAHQFPVSGLSSPYGDWAGFQKRMQQLHRGGRIGGVKDLYYFVRPTRYGTLELRCCDLPKTMDQVITLTALFQTLVVALSRRDLCPENVGLDVLRAELHAAYTHGLHARLLTHTGRITDSLGWYQQLVSDLQPVAKELAVETVLAAGTGMFAHNGAEDQLHRHRTQAVRLGNADVVSVGPRHRTQPTILPTALLSSAAAAAGVVAGLWW